MPNYGQIVPNPEYAGKIYEILHNVCGFDPRGNEKDYFIQSQTEEANSRLYAQGGCIEFRFCGDLGFGGKFWQANHRWYVNCYTENENEERRAMMKEANLQLAPLLEEFAKKNCPEHLREIRWNHQQYLDYHEKYGW